MNDNDLITRRDAELVLLEKGQKSRRYRLGDVWELDFNEIREALSEHQSTIVRCRDCKDYQKWNGTMICMRLGSYYGSVPPDWFCADAERRDGDG